MNIEDIEVGKRYYVKDRSLDLEVRRVVGKCWVDGYTRGVIFAGTLFPYYRAPRLFSAGDVIAEFNPTPWYQFWR